MTLPESDLETAAAFILERGGSELRGKKILITGGTGFLGRWLVGTFCAVNTAAALGARMWILTRNADHFRTSDPALTIVEGDVRSLGDVAGLDAPFDLVIHGATESSATLASGEPRLFAETIDGVRQTLEFAVRSGARRFLYLSSGAVYGAQPPDRSRIDETFAGAPNIGDPQSAYAETKRAGELLCHLYAKRFGLEIVIARGFAFVGPHIPLDRGFAAGNFVGDVLHGTPITVHGDGTTVRSYLYAADFAVWCWVLLLRGAPGRVYNVGSEVEVTIGELAREAAQLKDPATPVRILGIPDPASRPARYVPSTERARHELGLQETTNWRTGLRKTYEWYSAARSESVQ